MAKNRYKIIRFLKLKNYYNLIIKNYISLRIRLSKPLVLKTHCLGYPLLFSIKSLKEYYYRYLLSYVSEKSTIFWIENHVKKSEVVWDVGANVGAYSILIGKLNYQDGIRTTSVFSFEPESSNYYSLNQNILLNNLTNLIMAYPCAIGSETRLASFFISSNEVGSATHAVDHAFSDGEAFYPTHVQGTLVVSLDDLVNKYGLPFPSHLKIDVDGFEGEVIKGGLDIINDKRLKTILIEIGKGVNKKEIDKTISMAGFKLNMKEVVSVDGLNINYLYVR